jgi:hypothetical protein
MISPWADSADRISPDGRYQAVISDASEIRMGAPTSGTLVIIDKQNGDRIVRRHEGCNPSFVWSSDSNALAVPEWTRDLMQRLIVIHVPMGTVTMLPHEFRVLELHSFVDAVVRGVDSPIHLPVPVSVLVQRLK